ncbi:uncharacterized protein LOC117961015 [Etheostoma cragini]|uniref:uncharacterized protein LOC117961015 n=1 Tax=Etheostoma cragini TaxID=417921 RepID=UPI00155E0008|nr:uncharacterized protein LOC117961015 [Etheostoma cragini]
MHPSRHINDAHSSPGGYPPMFLRQLSSFSSSFLPRGRPPLCRAAGFRSSGASSSSSFPRCTPAPHPWCSVRGFPPRPPGLPRCPPAAQRVFSGRTLPPRSIRPGTFGGSWHPFSTSAGLMMEQPDREPPHKRRKSAEERRSAEETKHQGGGHGAKAGKARDGGSMKEHHHRDSSTDSRPRPHHGFKDGGKDRGTKGAGRGPGWTHCRDKDVVRTKTGNKDSQPQTPKWKQDKVPVHRPNPWFKGGAAEERGGGWERKTTPPPPEGQFRDRNSDGGPWTGLLSQQGDRTEASRQPPPTGTCPPVGQQEDAKPERCLQRHWETLPVCSADTQPPGDSTAFDFSVMSYNILSQDLLQDNAYLYRHCQPGVLPWDHRLPNLLAEIQQYNADVSGLDLKKP